MLIDPFHHFLYDPTAHTRSRGFDSAQKHIAVVWASATLFQSVPIIERAVPEIAKVLPSLFKVF